MSFGPTYTWKIVYYPTPDKIGGGRHGVALVEAANQSDAMWNFQHQYDGEYSTVTSCEKLF